MAGIGEAGAVLQRLLVDRRGADRRAPGRPGPAAPRSRSPRSRRRRFRGPGRPGRAAAAKRSGQNRQRVRRGMGGLGRVADRRDAACRAADARGSPIQKKGSRARSASQALTAISGPMPDGLAAAEREGQGRGHRYSIRSRPADDRVGLKLGEVVVGQPAQLAVQDLLLQRLGGRARSPSPAGGCTASGTRGCRHGSAWSSFRPGRAWPARCRRRSAPGPSSWWRRSDGPRAGPSRRRRGRRRHRPAPAPRRRRPAPPGCGRPGSGTGRISPRHPRAARRSTAAPRAAGTARWRFAPGSAG